MRSTLSKGDFVNTTTQQTIVVIFSLLFVAIMALVLTVSNAEATETRIDAIITLPDTTPPDCYLVQIQPPEPTVSDIALLKAFLVSDNTDNNPYIASGADNYVCSQYSIDLANNLSDGGFESGVVVWSAKYRNKGCGHIMTWAVVNGSLFVIEPQNDQVFNPAAFNDSIDREIYVLRYESVESGIRKASETYQRLI